MAQEMHLLVDGPPVYSDITGNKAIQGYRNAKNKLAGMDLKTLYTIHTIVVVLFDVPDFCRAFQGPFWLFISAYVLLFVDLFLLATICTKDVLTMKYVEVFSHLNIIYNGFVICGIILAFFIKDSLVEMARGIMQNQNPRQFAEFFGWTLSELDNNGQEYLFKMLFLTILHILSLSLRVYLSEKIIERLIESKREIRLLTHI